MEEGCEGYKTVGGTKHRQKSFKSCGKLSSMRTLLLALSFTFIMMVTMLHAGAVKVENEQKTKAKRNLLSETALGRKGIGSDTNDHSMKGSSSANTDIVDSSNNNKANNKIGDNGDSNDNKTNDSYQNYGNVKKTNQYLEIKQDSLRVGLFGNEIA
ncbi:hypothetical protein CR513_21133, partial [Mucuna pruriens]